MQEGAALLQLVMLYLVPFIITSIITITLNIYLTIKACKFHKQIERETRLAGTTGSQSERITGLKKK